MAKSISFWILFCSLLSACAIRPDYIQTAGSKAAFAFADRVIAGERGDLPAKARVAGLETHGVCKDVGNGAMYCNALRVTDFGFPGNPTGAHFLYDYKELRLCLRNGAAFGFLADESKGGISPLLFQEYPQEYESLLKSRKVRVFDEAFLSNTAALEVSKAIGSTNPPQSIQQLGYQIGGEKFRPLSVSKRYFIRDYPPYSMAQRACRG